MLGCPLTFPDDGLFPMGDLSMSELLEICLGAEPGLDPEDWVVVLDDLNWLYPELETPPLAVLVTLLLTCPIYCW